MLMDNVKKKKVRRPEGQIVRIDLKDGTQAFARVLEEPLFAFYDRVYRRDESPSLEEICSLPIAFKIWVMNYAVTNSVWEVIGRVPLSPSLKEVPPFFKQDAITGAVSIYQGIPELAPHYEKPATFDEVEGLECAAVWDPEHVEDRLRDHFAGRPNKWVEQLKIRPN